MKGLQILSTVGTLLLALSTRASALIPNAADVLEKRQAGGTKWISIWTSMPQLVEQNNLPPSPYNGGGTQFRDATLRQTLYMTLDTNRVRVQISNTFGGSALPITAATIALPEGGAAGVGRIDTSTVKPLTFNGGSSSITIQQGQVAYSDPIDFPVKAQQNIAISLYLQSGQSGSNITGHPGSRTTSWMANGNQVSAASVSAGSTVHWYFISGVEGWVSEDASTLIVLGDSITDGRGSDDNKNNRWPDLLLARLRQSGITNVAVGNQAAGGNCVLSQCLGPSLVSRYSRDAINQLGVKYVMIFEGVNDIGNGGTDAGTQQRIGDQLISAYQQIARDSKAKGYKVFGATITALGSTYSGGSRDSARQRVNNWILSNGTFDAAIDFDQFIRNPSSPSQLAQQYNSGDGLHPNVAGYQQIANQFPLSIFDAPRPTTTAQPPPITTTTPPGTPTTTTLPPVITPPPPTGGDIPKFAQCGGVGWSGAGSCIAGSTCTKLNDWYSQCL